MKKQCKDNKVKKEFNPAKEYCRENDIAVNWINDRQVRLTKDKLRVDIFPLGKKWHNITANKRGMYKDLVGFIMITFID